MEPKFMNLGKVCITSNGNWDKTKEYDRLSIVYNDFNQQSYISKKDVPINIEIDNDEYWQKIGASGYKNNNVIILSDTSSTGELTQYTLNTAILAISEQDRRPGLILGFYGINYDYNEQGEDFWYLYQFNSTNIANWENVDYWLPVIDRDFKKYIDSIFEKDIYPKVIPIDNLNSTDATRPLSAKQGNRLKSLIDSITSVEFRIVDDLPQEGKNGVIYLVPKDTILEFNNTYIEYIWASNDDGQGWERLGSLDVDSELNEDSKNPVENRVVAKAINNIPVLKDYNIIILEKTDNINNQEKNELNIYLKKVETYNDVHVNKGYDVFIYNKTTDIFVKLCYINTQDIHRIIDNSWYPVTSDIIKRTLNDLENTLNNNIETNIDNTVNNVIGVTNFLKRFKIKYIENEENIVYDNKTIYIKIIHTNYSGASGKYCYEYIAQVYVANENKDGLDLIGDYKLFDSESKVNRGDFVKERNPINSLAIYDYFSTTKFLENFEFICGELPVVGESNKFYIKLNRHVDNNIGGIYNDYNMYIWSSDTEEYINLGRFLYTIVTDTLSGNNNLMDPISKRCAKLEIDYLNSVFRNLEVSKNNLVNLIKALKKYAGRFHLMISRYDSNIDQNNNYLLNKFNNKLALIKDYCQNQIFTFTIYGNNSLINNKATNVGLFRNDDTFSFICDYLHKCKDKNDEENYVPLQIGAPVIVNENFTIEHEIRTIDTDNVYYFNLRFEQIITYDLYYKYKKYFGFKLSNTSGKSSPPIPIKNYFYNDFAMHNYTLIVTDFVYFYFGTQSDINNMYDYYVNPNNYNTNYNNKMLKGIAYPDDFEVPLIINNDAKSYYGYTFSGIVVLPVKWFNMPFDIYLEEQNISNLFDRIQVDSNIIIDTSTMRYTIYKIENLNIRTKETYINTKHNIKFKVRPKK